VKLAWVRKALEGLRVVDLSTLFAVPQVSAITGRLRGRRG